MKYIVRFRDDVFNEINEIYCWYELRSEGLGKIFLEKLGKCFDDISRNPFQYEKKNKNFRQSLTKKFPYLIIFEIESESILIYHIIHASRNPKLKYKK
jgi:hypothetical protein